jgi:hypothetical protein
LRGEVGGGEVRLNSERVVRQSCAEVKRCLGGVGKFIKKNDEQIKKRRCQERAIGTSAHRHEKIVGTSIRFGPILIRLDLIRFELIEK